MRRADGERGSASLWALAAGLLVLLAALVVTVRTEAVLARHRADAAADLAALAAASRIGVGSAQAPCPRAALVAGGNGASLTSCQVRLDASGRTGTVTVMVRVAVTLPFVGHSQATASARAARLRG